DDCHVILCHSLAPSLALQGLTVQVGDAAATRALQWSGRNAMAQISEPSPPPRRERRRLGKLRILAAGPNARNSGWSLTANEIACLCSSRSGESDTAT